MMARWSIQKVLWSSKLFAQITVYGCMMGRVYEIYTQWVHNRCIEIFNGKFFSPFVSCLHLPVQWDWAFTCNILVLVTNDTTYYCEIIIFCVGEWCSWISWVTVVNKFTFQQMYIKVKNVLPCKATKQLPTKLHLNKPGIFVIILEH